MLVKTNRLDTIVELCLKIPSLVNRTQISALCMKESTIYIVDTYTTSQQNRSLLVRFYWVVVDHIIVFTRSNAQDFPC